MAAHSISTTTCPGNIMKNLNLENTQKDSCEAKILDEGVLITASSQVHLGHDRYLASSDDLKKIIEYLAQCKQTLEESEIVKLPAGSKVWFERRRNE